MILVLDDDDIRHDLFTQFFQEKCVHAYSFSEFKTKFHKNKYVLVFLDHDLGDLRKPELNELNQEYTGKDVALFLKNLPLNEQPPRVVIHSTNNEGSQEMLNILKETNINVFRLFLEFR